MKIRSLVSQDVLFVLPTEISLVATLVHLSRTFACQRLGKFEILKMQSDNWPLSQDGRMVSRGIMDGEIDQWRSQRVAKYQEPGSAAARFDMAKRSAGDIDESCTKFRQLNLQRCNDMRGDNRCQCLRRM